MSWLNASCKSPLEIARSVVIKASMVHILGWIMPDPLHMPPTVTVFPPISNCTATSFGFVSVVIMALAASAASSRLLPRHGAIAAIPSLSFSIGSCIPITPVEATST